MQPQITPVYPEKQSAGILALYELLTRISAIPLNIPACTNHIARYEWLRLGSRRGIAHIYKQDGSRKSGLGKLYQHAYTDGVVGVLVLRVLAQVHQYRTQTCE